MAREDLSGRVCVVTGANTGIGKEIARGLALARATVVMAVRDEQKGEAARAEVVADTCNERVEVMRVDTSSQASIRAFAAELSRRHEKLHVLVNNAGVWPTERQVSVDGIEMTWATNVLGYYLLTVLLLDHLKASKPARVVNVASALARGLDLTDVQYARRAFDGTAAYAQSKQADRMLTWALDRRLEGTGVTANAVHPGLVATELARHFTGVIGAAAGPFLRLFARTPAQGADTAVWVAAADENERSSGNYYVSRKIKKCGFRDEAQVEALWRLCGEMTGERVP